MYGMLLPIQVIASRNCGLNGYIIEVKVCMSYGMPPIKYLFMPLSQTNHVDKVGPNVLKWKSPVLVRDSIVHSCSKVMGLFFAVAKYGVYF